MYGPLAGEFMKKYMHPDVRKQDIDTTFGIRYESPRGWMIGRKEIEIDVDDIIIDGEVYSSTPGLWSLITRKSPKDYTEHDLERYKELLFETSALHQHYDSRDPYPRASGGQKWKLILGPIWNDFQMTGMTPPPLPTNNSFTYDNGDRDSLDGTLIEKDDADFSDSDSVNSEAYAGTSILSGLDTHLTSWQRGPVLRKNKNIVFDAIFFF